MAGRNLRGPAPRIKVNVELPPELHAEIPCIAQRNQRPFGELVREALAQYVQRASITASPRAEG